MQKTVPIAVQQKRYFRRINSKLKKKRNRILYHGIPSDLRSTVRLSKKESTIVAPAVFSLKENADEFLLFIKELKNLFSSKKYIFIKMKYVQQICNGALAILLSLFNKASTSRTMIRGDRPENNAARMDLEKSGFFKFMQGNVENSKNLESRDSIIRTGSFVIDPESTASLIHGAMETVTGKSQKNPKIQRILIEMMANTINHAYPGRYSTPWWIATRHDTVNKRVTFSFIDNGVGIKNTIKKKLKLLDIIRLKPFFENDLDLIISAFNGSIGSRTGLPYRGKGLPAILKTANLGILSNFTIITNSVYYDTKGENSKILNEDFEGTFYSFELENQELL